MPNRNLTKVCLLLALLGLSLMPFSQAHPKRGRKRAFGVGLLGGAIAGGIIGNVMAKSHQAPAAAPAVPVAQVHHFYPAGAPIPAAPIVVAAPAHPDPKKMTVIETGTPDANGCYTQTVREPNPNNPKSYTETQHLICPTLKQANQPAPVIASAPSAAHVPVMPQPSPVIPAHVAGPPGPAPAAAPVAAPAAAPVIPVVCWSGSWGACSCSCSRSSCSCSCSCSCSSRSCSSSGNSSSCPGCPCSSTQCRTTTGHPALQENRLLSQKAICRAHT
ncbi:hypothetical protein M5D96_006427 [Drosophila gunungcola]|uniref:Uncharacterized protein n=1 Tax=Drosophila gunungcola TaxID=103775 RepID=A0A9P9YQ06_9MUSC|nr:hypothetical protein M5D96_006427 [Drosophila gunungcola]